MLPDSYRTYKLDNGLRVISMINRNFPVAVVSVHVNTGYSWEPDEISGISHVVEHNLMHASERRSDKKVFSIDRRMAGAQYDAGTSYDFTEYLIMVPSDNLSQAFDIMCDGFGKPVFHPEIFQSEMGAIRQESKRKMDMPLPMAEEKLYATAYKVDRKNRWRLGTEETFANMTPEALEKYFNERYGPGNYILVVSGDIDHDAVEKEVRETFGKLPARDVQGEYSPKEPPQNELRYGEYRKQLGQVYWMCGFHTPPYLAKENSALQLLSIVLGRGFNSRLNRKLREELGLVDEIFAGACDYDENAMFNVFMKTDTKRLEDAEKAVFQELFGTAKHPVTEDELLRARNMFERDILFIHDDLKIQTGFMNVIQMRTGNFMNCEKYMEEIFNFNSRDILKISSEYFKPQNLSVFTIIPEKDDFRVRNEKELFEIAKSVYENIKEEELEHANPLPERKPVSLLTPSGRPLDRLEEFNLKNGGKVILLENKRLPIFTSVVLFRGGEICETVDNCGITSLMQSVMLKGTEKFNSSELLGKIEAAGCGISPVLRDDYFGFALKGTSANFESAFSILTDILLNPSFPEKEIEIEKRKLIARINSIQDQPHLHSLYLFYEKVFKGHPYGLPAEGLVDVIAGLNREELLKWYGKMINSSNMVIAFGGNLEINDINNALKPLEHLASGKKISIPEFSPLLLSSPVEIKVEKKRNQTSTVVGYPTAGANHEDYPALEVIRGLTTGDGGRFWNQVRGERGLAYVIRTNNVAHARGGAFLAYTATSPETADFAGELLVEEYKNLYINPPEERELREAKNFITGLHLAGERTTFDRTLALAGAEVSGISRDNIINYKEKIEGVTVRKIKEVSEKYFIPERYFKSQVVGIK